MVSHADITRIGKHVPVNAVVFEEPQAVALRQLEMRLPGKGEVLVDVEWSGISTGTEKLLWSGAMPPFPGLGYPLVPGYETVGRIASVGPDSRRTVGERVFVSGASCYGSIRGLFGGAASRMVVSDDKIVPVEEHLGEQAILLALAATAHHALTVGDDTLPPDLIVGHGVLGRLLARLAIAVGGRVPTVWETNAERASGSTNYNVVDPASDTRSDYRRVIDASGDPNIMDAIVPHMRRQGEIVLAGFYSSPLQLTFPPAFMREISIHIAAEWQRADLNSVKSLVESGSVSLDDLITHRQPAIDAEDAYRQAFSDPGCLKMVLDWRS